MAKTVEQARAELAAAEQAVKDAKGKGVSAAIAASKALSAAKKELTAAEKGVDTAGKTRTQVLQEQRAVDMTAKAEARAATDVPVAPDSKVTFKGNDITQRPDAPPADKDFIYYYSWIGGATTGQWKLYRAPNNPVNQAVYGSRAIGGETQAEFGTSSSGANALAKQPQPIKDPKGNITGWTKADGTVVKVDSSGNITDGFNEPTGGFKFEGNILTKDGKPFTGKMFGTNWVDGISQGSIVQNNGNNNIPTGLDPATKALIEGLQAQIAALTASVTNQSNTAAAAQAKADAAAAQAKLDAAAAAEAAKKEKAQNAITVLTDRFNKYGLGSLVPKIKELAIAGASEDTISLQLQETPEYQQRFRANQDRIKRGLSVLSPADYLNLEDDYRQILRAYGLRQFDNDDYVTQFISNDISTTELSNRVATAVQRVQNADPAILTTLRSFYGISDNDLVAYVLDPNQQFQKIERQVAAAEIGAAAGLQGLSTGVAVAEQLAAQGITKAQAQKGYATIADILPTAEKLSDIYGGTLDEYRQNEAEQEVFNTLASAQRKRQKLIEREAASFMGSSALGKSSLTRQVGGQI